MLVKSGPEHTSNIVPYINKYCIIRACGSIEIAFKTIIADFINRRSKIQIKNYINKYVRENSSNPSYDNICKLLKSFDSSWNTNFKSEVNKHPDKSKIMTSIESLVDARNEFAHGGNPNIPVQSTIDYFYDGKTLIEILDTIII